VEVRFTIADFNTPYEDPESESADEALMDEEDEMGEGQSGGATTKGAVNQGKTSGGNFKVAPEDDIAPADRDELRNAEVCTSCHPSTVASPDFPLTLTTIGRRAIRLSSQRQRPHLSSLFSCEGRAAH
jgi:hypothetical protein